MRSSPVGNCPRPSLTWHDWQARALKNGPTPSEASVEAGEETQNLLNSALPSLKRRRSSKPSVDVSCEKALASRRASDVPAPP